MAAPQLTVQVQGQASVSADQLNTYDQTCDVFAQLRAFVGTQGVQVFARGQSAPNDGLGGPFYWDGLATGPDDNLDVIVPSGSVAGAWIRLALPGSAFKTVYDLPIYIGGAPSSGEVFPIFNVVRPIMLPAGLTGSIFTIAVNPTGTATFILKQSTTTIGSIAYSTLGVATVTFPVAITFATGDQFSVTCPNPADATAAAVAMTFAFVLVQ